MSEAGYDGETCASCVNFSSQMTPDGSIATWCASSWGNSAQISPLPGRPAGDCEHFVPSLQCRQVRAEEEANKLREERNRCLRIASSALERIADSLERRDKREGWL